MNRNQFISAAAASLVLLSSSAFAGDEFDPHTGFARDAAAAKQTRAQVVTQVLVAQSDGSLAVNRDVNPFLGDVPRTGLTRADVRRELALDRTQGVVPNFEVGSAHAVWNQPNSGLTRETVRAETLTALRAARSVRRGS
ncbi:MAG: hypothetical protein RLZZ618_2934 [Pseudomonadota bacterium]|jgi:hypothetical protein